MIQYYAPWYLQQPWPYMPYRVPYYPYYLQNGYVGSQTSTINQDLFNLGFMAGVNQVANSYNIRY
jgi:hypothetical protein